MSDELMVAGDGVAMAIMSLDPTGQGRKKWVVRWKAALNAFEITFEGRLTRGNNPS